MECSGGMSPPVFEICKPWLEIVVEPQSKFRFRYKSEMTGKHGSLGGIGVSTNPKATAHVSLDAKTYPTVKLHNFNDPATIRCSIVCTEYPHYPHAHLLSHNGTLVTQSFACEIASTSNSHTVKFQSLNAIYTGKKSARKSLFEKMVSLEDWDLRKTLDGQDLDEIVFRMNLNMVSLYFEAISIPKGSSADEQAERLCEAVTSRPIHHNKSTLTSELRIVRIDKYASFCTGHEEVFVLVEKVDKHNIQIKFRQENEQGLEIWKAYGNFTKFDVHHQYAIVFKTPPYRHTDIDTDIDVWVQLERPSDGATSPQIPFKYKPIERLRKMLRHTSPRNDPEPNPKRRRSQDQNDDENEGNNVAGGVPNGDPLREPVAGPSGVSSSSVRQGSSNSKFPCDMSLLQGIPSPETAHALKAALSIGETLHCWAETSDFNVVLQRLRHLLCLVDEHGNNALHTAIWNGQEEPFDQILNIVSGSKDVASIINDTNLVGLTPLALAVMLDQESFVQKLLSCRGDISVPNFEGNTPLHLAIKEGNTKCLRVLMESPSILKVINKYNYNSQTPLHLAVTEDRLEAIAHLCKASPLYACQDGTFGRTPLHMAIEKNNFQAAFLLLKTAPNKNFVNVQNYRGDTALHSAVAMETPSQEICAALLYYGADPTIENYVRADHHRMGGRSKGQTVFDLTENLQIVQILQADFHNLETFLESRLNNAQGLENLSLENLQIDSGIGIENSS